MGASLSGVLERYGLPATAGAPLSELTAILANDPVAPTTIRGERSVVNDHIADSLVALELAVVREARTIADLGSGAGFPGLPLAIALRAATVFLVESNARKCAFMERSVKACGVPNARVLNTRAELWLEGREQCDVITARAVASLPVVAEYAAPLLRIGGTLVVWRGARDPGDEAAGRVAADQLGLEPAEPLAVRPYPRARHRHLHLMSKVRETPPAFPRRPGAAQKRPLASGAA
jgi:16S rRNA (guanine527-N7)-methyltransferase